MITVIKLGLMGEAKARYEGEVIERSPQRIVIEAYWTRPAYDLGYTCFEPDDRFIEYYYTERWFNIFAISGANGVFKGWYCNIAEPVQVFEDHLEQVDLFLDVWVNPEGATLLLDEDEFAAATTLDERQRQGAQKGLKELLQMLEAREEPFSRLYYSNE